MHRRRMTLVLAVCLGLILILSQLVAAEDEILLQEDQSAQDIF
jgi:hypothetical protein